MYVSEKVKIWVNQLQTLSLFATTDPHAAYAAFTYGFIQKWKYVQRTIPDIKDLFQPLEDCLRHKFIPSLVGRAVSDTERKIFELPTRLGGLNIPNPGTTADKEYEWSQTLTNSLSSKIIEQRMMFEESEQELRDQHNCSLRQVKADKELVYKTLSDSIHEGLGSGMIRSLQIAAGKGSSIRLNTLPIKKLGFTLNKLEFQDALCLRYGFIIKGMPAKCACGKENSVDHALVCMLGGYTHMRHNEVRNVEAELLREVCKDVQVEPSLLPLTGQQFGRSANHQDMARLDVSARGLWGPMEKAFFDVRIFHPNADSNRSKSLPQLYNSHEAEKKRTYNDRIINVEHATFTPLVFSTSGGESPECLKFHKRLASLLCIRRGEHYSETITYIRRRVRFCILRTTLIALRGFRKPKGPEINATTPLFEVDIAVSEAAHRR